MIKSFKHNQRRQSSVKNIGKPKDLVKQKNTKSMLIKPHKPKLLLQIPQNLSLKITELDVSHNKISSLIGIQKYTELVKINLNHNFLDNYNQLNYLAYLQKLQELHIEQNPLSCKINYKYLVLLKVPQLMKINQLKIHPYNISEIKKWQHEVGNKLVLFQYQKCKIIQGNCPSEVIEQLKSIKQTIISIQKQRYQDHSIPLLNNLITDLFPLNSILSEEPMHQNCREIEEYLLEMAIKNAAKQQPLLLDELLSKIQIYNEQDEERIKNDVHVGLILIGKQLRAEYEFGCAFQQDCLNQGKHKNGQINIQHYISADTAMDTNERGLSKNKFMHFVMDQRYLNVLINVLKLELTTTIQYLNSKTENKQCSVSSFNDHEHQNELLSENQSDNQLSSQEEDSDQNILLRYLTLKNPKENKQQPKNIYKNIYIMENLLNNLHKTFQKIIFNRIKYHKNPYISILNKKKQKFVKNFHSFKQVILKKMVLDAFGMIQSKAEEQLVNEHIQELKYNKMKRLFSVWKKIKMRKLKLLMKYARKKTKGDHFIMAIALEKWKLNARAKKLKKMTSQIFLRVSHTSKIPKSRKGIQLAYKRVASKYKF